MWTPNSAVAVVLAGQHAWRDCAFDRLSPRPLLPVANQPLFSYAVQWLYAGGLTTIAIAANAHTRALRSAIDACEVPGLWFHEDPSPRGPAGSVRDATIESDAQTIVVVDGTTIPAADLRAVFAHHRGSGAAATVLVHPVSWTGSSADRFAPAGIYVFDRRAIERIAPRGYDDIKEGLLPRLYRAGEETVAYTVVDSSPRPHDTSTYLALNDWAIVRQAVQPAADGYEIVGSARCHRTAHVSADAVFVGDVLVGPEAEILDGATIVGPASIGAGSRVERGAVVVRSAAWRRCTIGEHALVEDCILANGATLLRSVTATGEVIVPAPREVVARAHYERQPVPSLLRLLPHILTPD